MVANLSSLTAAQNKPSAHQTGPATSAGPSFATMLNNEIHSSAPATPATPRPAPVANTVAAANKVASANKVTAANKPAQASSAPAAANTTPSSDNAKSAAATAAGSGSAATGKHADKSVPAPQTDTAAAASAAAASAAAATAATAATLAAASAGSVANAGASDGTQSAAVSQLAASATTAVDQTAAAGAADYTAIPTADQSVASATNPNDQTAASSNATQSTQNNLVANGTGNAVSGLSRDPNAKTVLNNGANTTSPLANANSGKAPAAPVITPTAVAAQPSQMGVTQGKSSAEHFGGQNPYKSGVPETLASGKAADAAPVSAATPSVQSAGASVAAPLNGNGQTVSAPTVTVQTANQNLSTQQLNAIAPVLTAPVNLEATTTTSTIAPQVGSSGWDQAVGQKISWMASGGQSSATLTLNPPELGPMQIVLNVNNQHASATFISHQPEVRAALESAIPKLREIMEQSGIQLGQCNVNSQARPQDFAQNQSGSGSSRAQAIAGIQSGNVSVMPSDTTALPRTGTGLVDTFV